MTALPTTAELTGSTRTNAEMKATHAALRDYLAGLLGDSGTVPAALAALGVLSQAGAIHRAAALTLTPADRGRVIHAQSNTWTLTLPALASVDVGWAIIVRNEGTGVITLQPVGADLMDHAANGILAPGAAVLLTWSAARWRSTMLAAGMAAGRLLRSAELMTGPTDATPGRIAQLTGTSGIFGLGGTYGPQLADLDATSVPAGLYFFNLAAGSTGTSPGFSAGAILVMNSIGAGATAPVQVALERSSGAGRMAWRTSQAGVRGLWRTVMGRGDMLGTVSQSGGVPTGAMMETGTNANGRYYRYADGRQICEHSLTAVGGATLADGALFRSAITNWTFPAAFAANPMVTGDVPTTGFFVQCASRGNLSTNGLRIYSTVSNAADTPFTIRAEGRWF